MILTLFLAYSFAGSIGVIWRNLDKRLAQLESKQLTLCHLKK